MTAISHQDNFGTNLTSNTNAGDTTSPLNSIPSVAAPFYIAFDATNVNGHYEVKQISSKTATNVLHTALAYAHTTAEEVRMVVPAVELDNFQTKDGGTGWFDSEAATYVSKDGSTGIFNIASDVTGKYSPGMRYKYKQDQALTAYWNFDADSTSQVGSFNGTDTAMTYTAGKFSNAATFNGTTSKIVITDNASLKPTGEFTIGCWFKTGTTSTFKELFQSSSRNTAFAGIEFLVFNTNVLGVVIGKNTGTVADTDYTQILGTTTVTDNVLHHAVVSFRNNYLQIYLDGKLEASGYCLTPAYAATNYVRVGCENLSGTDISFFNGQIDDLFLINGYALDEKTIKAKYDAVTAQGTGNITIDKYALITAVAPYAAGVTPITIWGGTDYSLQNATISNPYYSTVHNPFGFDRNKNKWKVELTSEVDLSQSSPSQNTWYNVGGLSISVPIGSWELYSEVSLYSSTSSAGNQQCIATLSTTNNAESDANSFKGFRTLNTSLTELLGEVSLKKNISVSVKTPYYLNISSSDVAVASIHAFGTRGRTLLSAVPTLL
jgi:hypothetical protein